MSIHSSISLVRGKTKAVVKKVLRRTGVAREKLALPPNPENKPWALFFGVPTTERSLLKTLFPNHVCVFAFSARTISSEKSFLKRAKLNENDHNLIGLWGESASKSDIRLSNKYANTLICERYEFDESAFIQEFAGGLGCIRIVGSTEDAPQWLSAVMQWDTQKKKREDASCSNENLFRSCKSFHHALKKIDEKLTHKVEPFQVVMDSDLVDHFQEEDNVYFYEKYFEDFILPPKLQLLGLSDTTSLIELAEFQATVHVRSHFDALVFHMLGVKTTYSGPTPDTPRRQINDDIVFLDPAAAKHLYFTQSTGKPNISQNDFFEAFWRRIVRELDLERTDALRMLVSKTTADPTEPKNIVVGFPPELRRSISERLGSSPTHFLSGTESLCILLNRHLILDIDLVLLHEDCITPSFDFDIDIVQYQAYLLESINIFQVKRQLNYLSCTYLFRHIERDETGKLVRGPVAFNTFKQNFDTSKELVTPSALLSGMNSNESTNRTNTLKIRKQLPASQHGFVLVVAGTEKSARFASDNVDQHLVSTLRYAKDKNPEKKVLLFHPSGGTLGTILKTAKLNFSVEVVGNELSVSDFFPVVDAVYTINNPVSLLAYASGLPTENLLDEALLEPSWKNCKGGRQQDRFLREFVDAMMVVDPATGENTSLSVFASHIDQTPVIAPQAINNCRSAIAKGDFSRPLAFHHFELLMSGKLVREATDFARQVLEGSRGNESPQMFINVVRGLNYQGLWEESFDFCIKLLDTEIVDKAKLFATLIVRTRGMLKKPDDVTNFSTLLRSYTPLLNSKILAELLVSFEIRRYWKLFLQIAEIEPIQKSIATELSYLRACVKLGEDSKAAEQFEYYCGLENANKIAALTIYAELLRANERWKLLKRLAYKLLKKNSKSAFLLALIAECHENLGNFILAEKYHWAAIKGGGATPYRIKLGQFYLRRFKFFEAYSVVHPARNDLSPSPQVFDIVGDYQSSISEFEKAAESYFQAVSLSPSLHNSYCKLRGAEEQVSQSGTMARQSWTERHLGNLEKIRNKTPDQYIALGRGHLENLDIDCQINVMNQALEKWPNDPSLLQWLAHGVTWRGAQQHSEGAHEEFVRLQELAMARFSDDAWWAVTDYMRGLTNIADTDGMSKVAERYGKLYSDSYNMFSKVTAIGEHHLACRAGDIKNIWSSRRNFASVRALKAQDTPFKTALHLEKLGKMDNILFLSEAGIGDEIRYATVYRKLIQRFPKAVFSADYRIIEMFERAFPNTQFLPVRRVISTELSAEKLQYVDQLPINSLTTYFDNELWKQAANFDIVMPVVCTLDSLLPTKRSYSVLRPKELLPNPKEQIRRAKHFSKLRDRPIFGLNWNSGIQEYRRMPHYLNMEQLGRLIEGIDATFVNLQYCEAAENLDEIKRLTGIDIINIENLDMRDDLDGVAALMKSLDLVIGVNTAVIELSAAVGVPTLFCAPRPENWWRAMRPRGGDAFFPEMTILTADFSLPTHPMDQVIQSARAEIAKRFPLAVNTPLPIN